MIVRDFQDRDVAPACALTNHYIQHTAVHFGMYPYSPDEFRAMWQEGVTKYPWLAAEIDGRFAGYAKGSRWREREAYQFTAEVGLYIERDLQGKGIGKALYLELFIRLKAAGYHTAVAGVTLPNDASVRLHESMGFAKVGVFREVGRKMGAWHDTGWWQLPLGAPDPDD
jgi:phosphinothricin acetyltransferase